MHAYSADPDQTPQTWHLIRVYSVCLQDFFIKNIINIIKNKEMFLHNFSGENNLLGIKGLKHSPVAFCCWLMLTLLHCLAHVIFYEDKHAYYDASLSSRG